MTKNKKNKKVAKVSKVSFSNISKKQRFISIITAAVVFASFGGYFIYRSQAAIPQLANRMYKVRINSISPSWGHVGIDSYWGRDNYVPCHHQSQWDEKYCTLKSWGGEVQYGKVYNYGAFRGDEPSLDKERAMYIPASPAWEPNLVQSLEVYSTPELVGGEKNSIGSVRIEVTGWNASNDYNTQTTWYTSKKDLGNITLPRIGDNKSALIYVNAKLHGGNAGNRVLVDVYGQAADTNYSSARYPIKGYFSDSTNDQGILTTSPLIPGGQIIYISDTEDRLSWQCNVTLKRGEIKAMNIDLGDTNGLNHKGCFRIATVPHVADKAPSK